MKKIALLVSLISFSSSFAGLDNSQLTTRLQCNVDAHSIKKLTILEDESDLTGWMRIDIEYTNGKMETRGINSNDLMNINQQELYITADGELNITLKKINEEYILRSHGDGYNQSQKISCNK
jgi:hypothetical protein